MSNPFIGSREWLSDLLIRKCNISSPHPYQLDHGLDLIAKKEVFLVVAPGMGKTTLLHAPLLAAQACGEKGIAIIVVPTKLLAIQQAAVACSRGLRALAIDQDTVREAYHTKRRDLFAELATGDDIRIGIMSPQMLQSEEMQKMLGLPKVKALIRWFFIDEVHLLCELSGDWHTAYQAVKYMRVHLLPSTIWAAIAGTATPDHARAIALDLGFRPGLYVDARYSVDRTNLKFIPRFLEHSVSGYHFLDISFLIPRNMSTPADIPTTLIFCETFELGWRVMDFLDRLIPTHIPSRDRVIRLYNSLMSISYRHKFIADIHAGTTLRIGVCTDTCSGLDISNIRRVIVFGLSPSMESLKQKIHRAGRNGAPAEVYTFAPAWVRNIPLADVEGKQAKDDAERRAKLCPTMLQWYNATLDLCPRHADLLNGEKFEKPEGCCIFHSPEPQTSADARLVDMWKEHFEEQSRLVESLKPKVPPSDGTYLVLDKEMKTSLTRMLEQWRGRTWISIRDLTQDLPSEFFLLTHLLTRLVDNAHICSSIERLRAVIPEWDYLDQYASELFLFLTEILRDMDKIMRARMTASSDAPGVKDEGINETGLNADVGGDGVTNRRQVTAANPAARPIIG
ncbi:P-loop containing nucleoside triphosphate hydrolase protein [Amylocystis lapponica]|nr:P-loop containing nucleoside triphosphate hydrolase protein [Amylocystis lapponica]